MTLSFNQLLRLLILAVLLTALFSATTTFAQALPCGNIITPGNILNFGQDDEYIITVPIVDCSNPFEVSGDTPVEYKLLIDDKEVQEGGEIVLPSGKTNDIEVVDLPDNLSNSLYLFKHTPNNYEFVSLYLPPPVTSDYIAYASEYFPTQAEADFYSNIYRLEQEGEDTSSYFINSSDEAIYDQNTGEPVFNRYQNYIDAATSILYSRRADISTGTYTLVINLREEAVLGRSWIRELRELFISSAYAQYIPINLTYTKTFTLSEEVPEPTGASSVLFIPGIMGSRLYEESAECGSQVTEQERWFSRDDCDQLRLATNFLGQSINSLYTKPADSAVLDDVFVIFNIYQAFLNSLLEWKDEGLINDYGVLSYDWRLGLDTIIRSQLNSVTGHIVGNVGSTVEEGYLYDLVTELAEDSANGKVTIVAHSNGGLVAKHFLDALDKANDPLLDKIENLILVAVPQVGTPDAVIGILHGTQLDAVMRQEVSRQLVNKMPFSHHLLPTLRYFESVETPIISFEEGSATNAWRSTWGNAITTRDGLHSFLDDQSGRIKPLVSDLSVPEIVDGTLLNDAKISDTIQSGFEIPETLKVYQIAGTGLETPSGLTYFTDRTCVNRTLFLCTGYADKLGYRVNMVIDGDESVVVPSALSLGGDDQIERWWLNLQLYNAEGVLGGGNKNRRHKDILEITEVGLFINQVISSSTEAEYEYLDESEPTFNIEESRLVFQLHSPLDMSLVSSDGRQVSSSSETINGATYRRYGELQYISVPASEEDLNLILKGTTTGSFTLDIEKYEDGETKRQTYSAIPSTPDTVVVVSLESVAAIEDIVLVVDYEGDGVSDVSYNTEGVIEEVVNYQTLITAIKDLNLKKVPEKVLLSAAKTAEKFYDQSLRQVKYKKLEVATLLVLKKELLVYERLKLISKIDRQSIDAIIETLVRR